MPTFICQICISDFWWVCKEKCASKGCDNTMAPIHILCTYNTAIIHINTIKDYARRSHYKQPLEQKSNTVGHTIIQNSKPSKAHAWRHNQQSVWIATKIFFHRRFNNAQSEVTLWMGKLFVIVNAYDTIFYYVWFTPIVNVCICY